MASSESGHWGTKGFLGVPTLVVSCLVVLALAAAGVLIATHDSDRTKGALSPSAALQSARRSKADKTHSTQPPPPIAVSSVSPAAGTASAPWKTAVTVRYSEPLTSSSPLPTITPSTAGSWDRIGSKTIVFHPVEQFVPFAKETVTVPADSSSTNGTTLGKAFTSSFTVEGASVLRLQELLAELGYLPVSFTPAGGGAVAPVSGVPTSSPPAFSDPSVPPASTGTTVVAAPGPGTTTDIEPSVAGDIPLTPLAGSFAWRFTNIPTTLSSLWSAGSDNEITIGAVMAFEAASDIPVDGVAGPEVWGDLLKAAAARQITTAPYDYVYVSKGDPEYVTVWRDGVNVFTTLANTGIPQSPTAPGTWPVYARYTVTTMSGKNPNGTTYHDPGIPWVSYFHGGDALHGFLRAQYGFPQSLGCVEMPYSSAKTVYPYTPYGTLVTVE